MMEKVLNLGMEVSTDLKRNSFEDQANLLDAQLELLDRRENVTEALINIEGLCHIKALGDLNLSDMQGWEWPNKLGRLADSARHASAQIENDD